MPFEWKLPPAQCKIPSHCQIYRQPRKNLHWTNRKTLETKELSHKLLFTKRKYAHSTALSKHLWDLKDKIQDTPKISWKIKKSAPAYNNAKRCILCLEEKMAIITFPEQQKLLNKRSELKSKCRHENKFLLHYYDSKIKKQF